MGRGVILYGPPASGKDTITTELTRQDQRFTPLAKLKAGSGRGTGYQTVSLNDLDALRDTGRLVVETHRYGNVYAIDRDDIHALTAAGRHPIVHMGNLADLQRLRSAIPLEWTCVLLWVPRHVCAQRSRQRGDTDTPKRLQAWDETHTDLHSARDTPVFDLTIHTDQTTAAHAARQIIDTVTSHT